MGRKTTYQMVILKTLPSGIKKILIENPDKILEVVLERALSRLPETFFTRKFTKDQFAMGFRQAWKEAELELKKETIRVN